MPLVQTASKIVSDPRKYLHLIYGEPGVGKTTWCSQMPGHYFLATEAGTSGVSIFGENIVSWEHFLEKCAELAEAKQKNFEGQRVVETIVIDSYDALWEYCGHEVMRTEKFMVKGSLTSFKKVQDVEFGKAYARVNEVVIEKLRKLRLMGFGVVVIGRFKERQVDWNGQKLTAFGLAMSDSVQNAIVSECDAVGFFMTEQNVVRNEKMEVVETETGRWQYWQPSFLRTAKHRLKGFPERLPLPMNGWEVYVNAFNETLEKNGAAA